MRQRPRQRSWKFIALVGLLLCLLLVPHPCSADSAACFLLIPILFFGLPVSHRLLSRMAYLRLGDLPEAPSLPPTFQRPPPSSFA
jgi:hypothetical protein